MKSNKREMSSCKPKQFPSSILYVLYFTYIFIWCVLLLLFALVVNSLVSFSPPSNNGTFIFFLPSLNIGDSWWKGSRSFVTQRRWHSLPPHPLARPFPHFSCTYTHTHTGKPLADWLWLPRPNYNLLLSYPLSKVIRRSPNVWDEVDVYESYIYPPPPHRYAPTRNTERLYTLILLEESIAIGIDPAVEFFIRFLFFFSEIPWWWISS